MGEVYLLMAWMIGCIRLLSLKVATVLHVPWIRAVVSRWTVHTLCSSSLSVSVLTLLTRNGREERKGTSLSYRTKLTVSLSYKRVIPLRAEGDDDRSAVVASRTKVAEGVALRKKDWTREDLWHSLRFARFSYSTNYPILLTESLRLNDSFIIQRDWQIVVMVIYYLRTVVSLPTQQWYSSWVLTARASWTRGALKQSKHTNSIK